MPALSILLQARCYNLVMPSTRPSHCLIPLTCQVLSPTFHLSRDLSPPTSILECRLRSECKRTAKPAKIQAWKSRRMHAQTKASCDLDPGLDAAPYQHPKPGFDQGSTPMPKTGLKTGLWTRSRIEISTQLISPQESDSRFNSTTILQRRCHFHSVSGSESGCTRSRHEQQ